jgi:hypothetical protein
MPKESEIILAVLGGSVSIAGLLLIFTGFLFSQAAGFPPSTPDTTIEKFRNAARVGVLPFAAAMLVAIISFTWVVTGSPTAYTFSVVGFFILLSLALLYGAGTMLLYL